MQEKERSDASRTKNSSEETRIWRNFGNDQSKYWSGIKQMMHVMRWSRPDTYNMTQDCTRHMMLAGRTHYNAMVCIMDYCMTTPERGLVLKPHGNWDGIDNTANLKLL